MSLLTIAQSAFTAILATAASAAVPVIYKSRTATGLRDTIAQGNQLTTDGNVAEVSGRVRVRCDQLDRPAQGDTLAVGGKTVFALEVRTDPLGALYTISYSETRPFVGVT